MKSVTRGAVAGLVGTAVMTGAIFVMKKAGMAPGKLAPKEITENLEEKLGVRNYLPEPAFEASWMILHFGYGTMSGVAYALAQKVLNRERLFPIGPLFGMLLWAIGYCAWLPGLGLYPPPTRLPKRKIGVELITTHLIYGTATAATHRVFRAKSGS